VSLTEHPEIRGADLISPAVRDILCEQFCDELRRTPDYADGTSENYLPAASAAMAHVQQKGKLTFADLLIMQAYECASKEDPKEFRRALASLGGTVIQAMESLDRRGVCK